MPRRPEPAPPGGPLSPAAPGDTPPASGRGSPAPPGRPAAWRVPLDGDVAVGHEALLVRDDPSPFALVGRWAGGGALVGSEPVDVAGPGADPLALLGAAGTVDGAPENFVGGGWVGYLGFQLARRLETHGGRPPGPEPLPPFALARYDHLLRRDADGSWWFEALWTPERDAALRARLDTLAARLRHGVPGPGPVAATAFTATPSPAGHARAVAACRTRIAHGDLYQANLALRLTARLPGDPADLFARAAAALRPDRAAYLWGAVASLSPELFLERHGDRVRSAPIKGTRRRDADGARAELERSEKDRAENVMIVDLVRNDLGRVCEPGTVAVPVLAEVRPHPGVWHLVSEVTGRLRPGLGDEALLRATFPPGSVTGAPKVAAVDVIDALESSPRAVFTGAIGFASPAAGLELSVAIRTFEIAGDAIRLDVGGGVTADSDPAAEAAEALDKARPLLAAIGARVAVSRAAAGPAPRRLGPRPVPRPDAAGGLLETIRVVGGAAVALEAHLARLAASMRALYGRAPEVEPRARAAAAALGGGRLRLLADPDGTVAVEASALPEAPAPVALEPVCVPGGMGAHKWRDRRLLDALAAAAAPATALLVDLDGHVLETTTAAVLLVDANGVLTVPPLDGRILPSVTRARALARAGRAGVAVREHPVTLDDLAAAREVLLASALRGVRPVGPPGPVAALLGEPSS